MMEDVDIPVDLEEKSTFNAMELDSSVVSEVFSASLKQVRKTKPSLNSRRDVEWLTMIQNWRSMYMCMFESSADANVLPLCSG